MLVAGYDASGLAAFGDERQLAAIMSYVKVSRVITAKENLIPRFSSPHCHAQRDDMLRISTWLMQARRPGIFDVGSDQCWLDGRERWAWARPDHRM